MFFTFAGVLVRTLTGEQTDDFKWEKVKKEKEMEERRERRRKSMVNVKSSVCDFLFYSQCPYLIIAWWHI